MRFGKFLGSTFIILGFVSSTLFAECDHSTKNRNNDLSPIARMTITPRFCSDRLAIGFMGELGDKQNRANGTMGIMLDPSLLLKFGGEVLNQKLTYRFSSGHKTRWMKQYAAGGTFQFVIRSCWIESVDVGGRWSRAPSRKLQDALCDPYITLKRHIAGSTGYGFNAGVTVLPWKGARLNAGVLYDQITYHVRHDRKKHDDGYGGLVCLEQNLTRGFLLNLKAEFRQPYNYYVGEIRWKSRLFSDGDCTLGAFGGYTQGHHKLPSSTTAGVEIGFDFGGHNYQTVPSPNSYYDSCGQLQGGCRQEMEFLAWLGQPAVYMPQVLAKAEEKFEEKPCVSPTSMTVGTRFFSIDDLPAVTQLATLFDGHGFPLAFSLDELESTSGFSSLDMSIDATTGALSIKNVILTEEVGIIEARVKGTTRCGSTSQTFYIFIFGD